MFAVLRSGPSSKWALATSASCAICASSFAGWSSFCADAACLFKDQVTMYPCTVNLHHHIQSLTAKNEPAYAGKVLQEIVRWIRDDPGPFNSFIAGGSAGYVLSAIQCEQHASLWNPYVYLQKLQHADNFHNKIRHPTLFVPLKLTMGIANICADIVSLQQAWEFCPLLAY